MHLKLISHSHDPALQADENLTGSPNTASPRKPQLCAKPDIIDRKNNLFVKYINSALQVSRYK